MCGRYVTPEGAAIEREYELTAQQMAPWISRGFNRNYNTSPTQQCPILRVVRDKNGERQLEPMRWGLVPFWAKGIAPKYSTINAMVETLEKKPAYRGPWKRGQRCIFPVAGFYEWQLQQDGSKIPYYIQPADDDELFSLAGLWDSSATEAGEEILSCTIITMPANELVAEIHNVKKRMPLIIHTEDVDTWLTGELAEATELLLPYPSELMRAHPVSKRVNNPRDNTSELILPISI